MFVVVYSHASVCEVNIVDLSYILIVRIRLRVGKSTIIHTCGTVINP